MRISDWSSDVCSSDLLYVRRTDHLDDVSRPSRKDRRRTDDAQADTDRGIGDAADNGPDPEDTLQCRRIACLGHDGALPTGRGLHTYPGHRRARHRSNAGHFMDAAGAARSEEHTHEIQSLMRIS